MAVYVDTGAWIALHEPGDRWHDAARATHDRLRERREVLVTGWHTVVEFIDGLAGRVGQERASVRLSQLTASPAVRIEPSEPHLDGALDLFAGRTDWDVDLSDCLSFALMEALELDRAFAYDPDFEKAGFEVVG